MNHPFLTGPAFKVVSENDHLVVGEFRTRSEAQERADELHASIGTHFMVYEVKFCGGSKKLSHLLDRRGV